MLMIFRYMLKTHIKIKFHCIGRDCKENSELQWSFQNVLLRRVIFLPFFFFSELKTKIYTRIYMHDLI